MKALASILVGTLLLSTAASAEETIFGGLAPAMLPAGSTSAYGFVGAPEVGAGFRQGLGPVELNAEASFNYLDLALAGVARLRFQVYDGPSWKVAPFGGLGIAWDSGSTYYDQDNFQYTAVRLDAGAVATYPVRDTLSLLLSGEVTWDLFTTPRGGHRVQPLVGAGAELALGGGVSAFALGELGADFRKQPDEWLSTELGYSLRIGFAFRMF